VSTLDNLKKEAKRFLKTLRESPNNPVLRQRLRVSYPKAPESPGLRDIQHLLARERGYENWKALRTALAERAANAAAPDAVARFLDFACWDHHTHGMSDFVMYEAAAMRMLAKEPALARAELYTAIVCGEIDEMRRRLDADPSLVNVKGGPRRWEPLLYLCYAHLPLPALRDNAIAMARELLDRGANPNAYYMAGDSIYGTLVGVAGEGEQDAPPHVQREALYALLLERGADPFDMQVLYNTFFHGHVQWWLELTYAYTVAHGRADAWADPEWMMLGMGGYGSGARFILELAINKGNVALAEWALARGASPNATPSAASRTGGARGWFSPRSLYQEAIRQDQTEIAQLLLRHGADPRLTPLDPEDAFLAAAVRLDRETARTLLEQHPEFRESTKTMFFAAERDRADVIALLLDLGVSPEVTYPRNERTMHIAAGADARRVVRLLIERGAEIDPIETNYAAAPIGYASHYNREAMIDLLTPYSRHIWTLAHRGKIDRLREVLRAEPELARQRWSDGLTPLWWLPNDDARAVEVVELLLAHGADPAVKSARGTTAADYARKRGLDRAADILIAAATGISGLTRDEYDGIADDFTAAYDTGDATALQRLNARFQRRFTQEDVRAAVWRRVRRVREAQGDASAFQIDEARDFVARLTGFGGWDELTTAIEAPTAKVPPPFDIDTNERSIRPQRFLVAHEWDALIETMKEQRLTALDANGLMTDAVLARLADLDHVTKLSLGGSREMSDDGLQQLARMPQLEHLDLNEYPGGRLTDRGLEVLRHLPNLRTFLMTWQRGITDAGVANLRFCEQIETVNLLGTHTGDATIAALGGKPKLRRFYTGRLVTDAGLRQLHDIPCFATWQGGELKYSLVGFDTGPTFLLLDGPFTNAGLAALAGLDGLFGLTFFWHISAMTPDGFAAFADLPNLGMLGVGDKLGDDTAMRHIARIPRLRMLQAQGAVATDEGFEALSASRSIEHIWGRDWEHLTGRGFQAMSRMSALRGLAVELKNVDDASLAALPEFPALRELVPMGVRDEGFRHVGACTALEKLTMMYCRDTTDRATEQIGGLSRLASYYAGATQITDRSLELLARLPTLSNIEIYECLQVTDAGLPFLARMPQLRHLSLSGLPKVTRAGTAVFPPNVKVDYWP
jgi:ankyrin repeat protein